MEVVSQHLQHMLYRHSLSKWWVYILETDAVLGVLPTYAKHMLYQLIMERGYRLLDDLRDLTPGDLVGLGGCGKVTCTRLCRALDQIREREHALDMLMYVE